MSPVASHADSASEPIGPLPPFDPGLAAVATAYEEQLAGFVEVFGADGGEAAVAAMREGAAASLESAGDLTRNGALAVSERLVPGPPGAPDVELLICLPTSTPAPYGAVYRIHGGGMIGGDRYLNMPMYTGIAEELGLAVISVEYLLAPEHPHPAPVEDCYAGLAWTVKNAAELGIDPDRIVVAGESAGANLAAATVLLVRDRGELTLFGQVLLGPMLDDRDGSCSARQMAEAGLGDTGVIDLCWTAFLGTARGGPEVSPYAAPARAVELSGLPPTFIDTGSAEIFRDEAVEYARRIWRAGGSAELHVWPGGFHSFNIIAPEAPLSRAANRAPIAWLGRLFAA
ncbi:alpha/beta hydrolase [Streptomyces sp. NPDC050528]|uniref:alpha/beta hydrolase n=1 Tax=Streptomyces sp. NPDC050528 TaxID=3365623 RepID=UPI00378A1E8F